MRIRNSNKRVSQTRMYNAPWNWSSILVYNWSRIFRPGTRVYGRQWTTTTCNCAAYELQIKWTENANMGGSSVEISKVIGWLNISFSVYDYIPTNDFTFLGSLCSITRYCGFGGFRPKNAKNTICKLNVQSWISAFNMRERQPDGVRFIRKFDWVVHTAYGQPKILTDRRSS